MTFLPRTRATTELFPRMAGTQPSYSFGEILAGQRVWGRPILEPVSTHVLRQVMLSGICFETLILLITFRHFCTRDF
jgi:hypothetical protein